MIFELKKLTPNVKILRNIWSGMNKYNVILVVNIQNIKKDKIQNSLHIILITL